MNSLDALLNGGDIRLAEAALRERFCPEHLAQLAIRLLA